MNTITTFLGRFCVLAALIAAPWANVGADAKNFRILLYLALASGILAFVSLWTTPRRDRRTNAYFGTIATAIPLALGLALAVFQFQPLSEETLARVSPRVLELKAELLPPDCVGSAHITETDRSVKSVDAAETVEATKSVDAAGTVEAFESVDAAGTVGTTKSVDAAGTVEAIESIETAGTVGTTGTVDAAGTVGTTGTVEAFATGEAPSLDAFADPKFRAPALLDEAEETALREALSEPFPFDPETPFDLQSATAVDAAVERAFLPVDAPARNAWGRTISVYPLATRQTTLIFGTALIFFLSTAILFNSNASRRFLWSAVALNGLAVALFCLAGRANPAIFENEAVADWLSEKRFTPFERLFVGDDGTQTEAQTAEAGKRFAASNARYGMYVNRNAAAGYLVLCFAAAIGPIVLAFLKTARVLEKERADRKRERAEAERWNDVYETRRDPFWKRTLGDFFDLFDRRFVFWAAVAGLILGAIFASLSRGASVAAFGGFAGTALVLALRKEGRRYWPAVAASGAIALTLILWTGLAQRVDARMSTLVEEDVKTGETAVEADARWENWRGAAKTWREYPWLGSGLGTYYIANYQNDKALSVGGLFYYAENSFVQTRLEMGRVGAILYVLTYVALLGCVGRLIVGRRSRETLAVGCAGICLIIGQFLASMGDFGVYLPANLFLFAALCGACVARKNVRKWEKLEAARANSATRPQAVREERRATRRELAGASATSALLLLALLGGRWALNENADAVERTRALDAQEEIRRQMANVDLEKREKDETFFFALPSSATLDAALADLRLLIERRDDSYQVRAAAAYLELLRFRIVQFEEWRDAGADGTDEELWARTAPELWEASLRHYRRLGYNGAAADIRSKEAIAEAFPQILADWTAARRLCPLEPGAHTRIVKALAAATPIVWEREREAAELAARRVAKAAPYDARAVFNAGRELFRVDAENLWPKFWRRAAEFSNARWRAILSAVELGVPASKQEAIVAEIMPNEPKKAREALTLYYPKRNETSFFDALRKNAEKVFETVPQESRDADYYAERAYFNKLSEKYEAAEADFRKALEARPDSLEFELQLGILLCEQTRLLQKDEECVKLLQRVEANASGSEKRQAETWLRRAERNLYRSQARAKLAEKERAEENAEKPAERPESAELPESAEPASAELPESAEPASAELPESAEPASAELPELAE